jgi:hypothetical protein
MTKDDFIEKYKHLIESADLNRSSEILKVIREALKETHDLADDSVFYFYEIINRLFRWEYRLKFFDFESGDEYTIEPSTSKVDLFIIRCITADLRTIERPCHPLMIKFALRSKLGFLNKESVKYEIVPTGKQAARMVA